MISFGWLRGFPSTNITNSLRHKQDNMKPTKQDLKKAQDFIDSLEFKPVDIDKYKKIMNEYCTQYNANSYYELMSRADNAEFPGDVCVDILWIYTNYFK